MANSNRSSVHVNGRSLLIICWHYWQKIIGIMSWKLEQR